MSAHYRFETRWQMPFDREHLFAVLADVGRYPAWWPQVRAVARLDDDTAHVVARSLLPYSLDLVLTRVVEDSAAGVLEARITGQLDGWSRWTIDSDLAGTALRYEQEVTAPGRLMTAASAVARPVLEANHTWMMRGGRRGLLRRGPVPGGRTSP
ncbi:MAG TPA: SRPBCC family protein [Nocardioidaceae bacterium]|nr:SRPBCC family protein [Nocardioidaceae bacterium]